MCDYAPHMQEDDTIVAAYLDAVAAAPDVSDADLHDILRAAGYRAVLVAQALQFIPIAFGRALVADVGVRFSPNFILVTGDGLQVKRGALDTLVTYRVARSLLTSRADVMRSVGLRSAEVRAINSALHAGSKPADLSMAPIVAFTDPASEIGTERAHELVRALAQHEAGVLPQPPPEPPPESLPAPASKPPWWKIW